jgi:hypothetical protein
LLNQAVLKVRTDEFFGMPKCSTQSYLMHKPSLLGSVAIVC